MNKNTKNTKSAKNTANHWFEGRDLNNPIMTTGYTKKCIYSGDNVNKWCVEVASKTQNDKIRRAWITVVDFDGVLKEGMTYDLSLIITTNSHNNRMSLEFVLDDFNCLD